MGPSEDPTSDKFLFTFFSFLPWKSQIWKNDNISAVKPQNKKKDKCAVFPSNLNVGE